MKFKKAGLIAIIGLLVIGIICGAGAAAHVDPNSFSKTTTDMLYTKFTDSAKIATIAEVRAGSDNLSDIIGDYSYSSKYTNSSDSQSDLKKSVKEAIISGLLSQAVTNNDNLRTNNDSLSNVESIIFAVEKKAGSSASTSQELLAKYRLAEVIENYSENSGIFTTEENTKSTKLASALALAKAYVALSDNTGIFTTEQKVDTRKNASTSSIFKIFVADYTAEKLADTILSNYVGVNGKLTDSQIETLSRMKAETKSAIFDKILDRYIEANNANTYVYNTGIIAGNTEIPVVDEYNGNTGGNGDTVAAQGLTLQSLIEQLQSLNDDGFTSILEKCVSAKENNYFTYQQAYENGYFTEEDNHNLVASGIIAAPEVTAEYNPNGSGSGATGGTTSSD